MLGGGIKEKKSSAGGIRTPYPCVQNSAHYPLDQLLYAVTVGQHTRSAITRATCVCYSAQYLHPLHIRMPLSYLLLGSSSPGSKWGEVHVVVDSHVVTGQNEQSTLTAVQNLILISNARYCSTTYTGIIRIYDNARYL